MRLKNVFFNNTDHPLSKSRNIFHLPPNECRLEATKCHKIFSQINNNDKFYQSHPALPWHIDKNYDYLKSLKLKDLKKGSLDN